jgi:acrylyl-CoA reductase (NADPH)
MQLDNEKFIAFNVEEMSEGDKTVYKRSLIERSVGDLPLVMFLFALHIHRLNYKDALSAQRKQRCYTPISAYSGNRRGGVVAESDSADFKAGDEVVVIGYDLGMNTAGGFGQFIRVPADWVVKRPSGITLAECMVVGTAGFTAALCVEKLLLNGLSPEQGPVLVTGASGGVGSFAVALLTQLGYGVTAMTGSDSSHDFLRKLGATDIISRDDYVESSTRPMLRELWAGAVDVVGGDILFNVVKSLKYGASVACCGLVASPVFQASVFPFILRGVNLLGVDSVNLPLEHKRQMWNRLAGNWKPEHLSALETRIGMNELDDALTSVLNGKSTGRLVLDLSV